MIFYFNFKKPVLLYKLQITVLQQKIKNKTFKIHSTSKELPTILPISTPHQDHQHPKTTIDHKSLFFSPKRKR